MLDDSSKIVQTLGADLRALRKARGMTLSDIAHALGKSVGWISQVERDLSTPTIDDLRAMAKALNVPLSLFFGDSDAVPAEQGHIVRANARRAIGGGDLGLTEELLSPDLTDDFEVVHSVFAPGAKSTEQIARPTQELGYIISGNLTLWIENERFDLNPGDAFRIRQESYAWENPHSEPAVAIWVIAPPVY